jgi:hypothetical protein
MEKGLLLPGVICFGLMVSCGGGGGGGISSVEPAQPASQLSLTYSPNSIVNNVGTQSNWSPVNPWVYLTIANWEPQTELYFNAYGISGLVDDVVFSNGSDPNSVIAVASFPDSWWLGSGTYTDSLTFSVSTDEQGLDQIKGSPVQVPVTYTVSGPAITSVAPMSVVAGGPAFTLTVTGTGFDPTASLIFNNVTLPTTFVSPTMVTAQVPADAIANAYDYRMLLICSSLPSEYWLYQVIPSGGTPPAISPSSAVAGGPDFTLTYTSSGIESETVLQWNDAPLTTNNNVHWTQPSAVVPASAIASAGTAMVFVTWNGAISASFAFPIQAAGATTAPGPLASPAGGSPIAKGRTLEHGGQRHWAQVVRKF